MNRQILRTLAISNKWLDRCRDSEQHDRGMNNLISTCENVTKGM